MRLQAIRDLSYLGDPRAAGPLVALLQDPRKEVRRDASRAIWQLGEAGLNAMLQAYPERADPFVLETLWTTPPTLGTAQLNRIALGLLFAMLGRFVFDPPEDPAPYEQQIKHMFSQASWEALLDWKPLVTAAHTSAFASGLYTLIETTSGDQPVQGRAQRANKLVLVIEDDTHLVEGIIDIIDISLEDVAVLSTTSGSSGLVLAQALVPDLIITDVIHPGLNGLESMRYLRDNPKVNHIPFVFLTAATPIEHTDSGALAYLAKPFDADELIGLLKTALWGQA